MQDINAVLSEGSRLISTGLSGLTTLSKNTTEQNALIAKTGFNACVEQLKQAPYGCGTYFEKNETMAYFTTATLITLVAQSTIQLITTTLSASLVLAGLSTVGAAVYLHNVDSKAAETPSPSLHVAGMSLPSMGSKASATQGKRVGDEASLYVPFIGLTSSVAAFVIREAFPAASMLSIAGLFVGYAYTQVQASKRD